MGPDDPPNLSHVAILTPLFDRVHNGRNALLTEAAPITIETTSESIRLEDSDFVQVVTNTSV